METQTHRWRVQLPEDILVLEILPWLPTETLVRFKSVCKSWLRVISEDRSNFTVEQWRRSCSSAAPPAWLIAKTLPELVLVPRRCGSSFSPGRRYHLACHLACCLPAGISGLLAPCNGLLCGTVLRAEDEELFLSISNPIIGMEERVLLDPRADAYIRSVGFAYEPLVSLENFKVVVTVMLPRGGGWGFSVFDSRKGGWAPFVAEISGSLAVFPPLARNNKPLIAPAIYAGGVLYWDVNDDGRHCVWSFDPWKEMAGTLPLPEKDDSLRTDYLFGKQDDGRLTCIGLLSRPNDSVIRLWLLVHGGGLRWEMRCSVDLTTSNVHSFLANSWRGRGIVDVSYFLSPMLFCTAEQLYVTLVSNRPHATRGWKELVLRYDVEKKATWEIFHCGLLVPRAVYYYRSSFFPPPKPNTKVSLS